MNINEIHRARNLYRFVLQRRSSSAVEIKCGRICSYLFRELFHVQRFTAVVYNYNFGPAKNQLVLCPSRLSKSGRINSNVSLYCGIIIDNKLFPPYKMLFFCCYSLLLYFIFPTVSRALKSCNTERVF